MANLRSAIEAIGKLGKVTAVSPFYETEPVEYRQQPWFMNCAVALDTDKTPKQLLAAVLNIERDLGRERATSVPKGPRAIDIDILLFGSAIIATPELAVPHPAMHERRFVLEPLAAIAPEAQHPILKRTVRELRDLLASDGQAVRRLA